MEQIVRANWIIEGALCVVVLVSMYLTLAGVDIHQPLGVIIALSGWYRFIEKRHLAVAVSRQVFARVFAHAAARFSLVPNRLIIDHQ
jgi:hypothetical protein